MESKTWSCIVLLSTKKYFKQIFVCGLKLVVYDLVTCGLPSSLVSSHGTPSTWVLSVQWQAQTIKGGERSSSLVLVSLACSPTRHLAGRTWPWESRFYVSLVCQFVWFSLPTWMGVFFAYLWINKSHRLYYFSLDCRCPVVLFSDLV